MTLRAQLPSRSMAAAIGCLCCLVFVSPARAGFEFANWGMTTDQVVSASNGGVVLVKDDKDKRIENKLRLATGRTTFDGVTYSVNFYFEPKTKTLAAINFVPAESDCDAAIAAHKSRFGTPVEKRTETVIDPRKPPLVQTNYAWSGGPLDSDSISGVDVSVKEMDIRYCQFLRAG